jgi:hypothetical protein
MMTATHLSWLFVFMAALLVLTAAAVHLWSPDVRVAAVSLRPRELLGTPHPIYRLAAVDFCRDFATAPWFALVIPFYVTESLGRPSMNLGTLFFVESFLAACRAAS